MNQIIMKNESNKRPTMICTECFSPDVQFITPPWGRQSVKCQVCNHVSPADASNRAAGFDKNTQEFVN